MPVHISAFVYLDFRTKPEAQFYLLPARVTYVHRLVTASETSVPFLRWAKKVSIRQQKLRVILAWLTSRHQTKPKLLPYLQAHSQQCTSIIPQCY
jgi:hypothetical protein